MTGLAAAAETLRALHRPGTPLILPNAWDATSAMVVAEHGFPVVATSSAALARSLGYDDGEQAPASEIFAALGRITSRVGVPVTADLESGYGLPPADLVAEMLKAGVVGLNVEDTDHAHARALRDPDEQAERIAAIKAAGRSSGVDIVVNARVDCFLPGRPGDTGLADGLGRARRYAAAGADCVYPILLDDESGIERFVAESGAPVNVMLHPGGPGLDRLRALRVARVSLGAGLARIAFDAVAAHLESLRAE